jgi:hypothetical protein
MSAPGVIRGSFLGYSVPNWESFPRVIAYPVSMKKKELTPEQLSSVPCPTCGVAAGESCVLNTGALRSGPHVERKFSAIEAVKRNQAPQS